MVSTHHQLTNHDIATNNNLQPFANKNNQANLLFFLKSCLNILIQKYVHAQKTIKTTRTQRHK